MPQGSSAVRPTNGLYLYLYLFHCANTSAQREDLKQQIGTWPASKKDLIIKHQKEYCAFVESIDFDDLKVGNQST